MNINLSPFPELRTGRLLLRRLIIIDRGQLLALRSDDRVNKYLDRDSTTSMGDAEAFIKKIDQVLEKRDGIYWAIALKADNVLIGTICYYNFVLEDDIAEIGYELNPWYHGQGIMQEAIKKVIEYGFNQMNVKIITACPRADNVSSVKLLQRNNFIIDPAYEYLNEDDSGQYLIYCLKKDDYNYPISNFNS